MRSSSIERSLAEQPLTESGLPIAVGIATSASRRTVLDRFLSTLSTSRFLRSVVFIAGGTTCAQFILFAVSPIISRLYSPEAFGIFAVFSALFGILGPAASFRFEMAVPLPQRDEYAANIAALSLAIIPFFSLLVGVATWIGADYLVTWTQTESLKPYLWLLPAGMMLFGIYQVFVFWAIRKRAFKAVARTRAYQGVATALIQLTLFSFGPLGLILAKVLGSATGLTALARIPWQASPKPFRHVSILRVLVAAKRYRRFAQFSAPGELAIGAADLLPSILFAALFSPFVAGQYALVNRVIKTPLILVGQAVSQVFMGEGAIALRANPARFYRLYIKTSICLAIVGAAIGAVLLFAGPFLFRSIFGRQWEIAGVYARILSIFVSGQLVAAPLKRTLAMLERQSWHMGWAVLELLLVVVSIALPRYWSLGDLATLQIFSYTLTAAVIGRWCLGLVAIRVMVRSVS